MTNTATPNPAPNPTPSEAGSCDGDDDGQNLNYKCFWLQDEWNRYICYYCNVFQRAFAHDDKDVETYDGRKEDDQEGDDKEKDAEGEKGEEGEEWEEWEEWVEWVEKGGQDEKMDGEVSQDEYEYEEQDEYM